MLTPQRYGPTPDLLCTACGWSHPARHGPIASWRLCDELKDIQLPDSTKPAMARQAVAERDKRAKIISAEGEALAAAALGDASDTMMAHPLALQLRNLQSLVEIGVDKNTTSAR